MRRALGASKLVLYVGGKNVGEESAIKTLARKFPYNPLERWLAKGYGSARVKADVVKTAIGVSKAVAGMSATLYAARCTAPHEQCRTRAEVSVASTVKRLAASEESCRSFFSRIISALRQSDGGVGILLGCSAGCNPALHDLPPGQRLVQFRSIPVQVYALRLDEVAKLLHAYANSVASGHVHLSREFVFRMYEAIFLSGIQCHNLSKGLNSLRGRYGALLQYVTNTLQFDSYGHILPNYRVRNLI